MIGWKNASKQGGENTVYPAADVFALPGSLHQKGELKVNGALLVCMNLFEPQGHLLV